MSQRSELIQTIQDIENGLAMNPTGEILERLTSRLARAKAKLDGLDEKKSVELSANLALKKFSAVPPRVEVVPEFGVEAAAPICDRKASTAGSRLIDRAWAP